MEQLASDTSSIEGGPPFSAEPHGWGISMSVSGEFQRARSGNCAAEFGRRTGQESASSAGGALAVGSPGNWCLNGASRATEGRDERRLRFSVPSGGAGV